MDKLSPLELLDRIHLVLNAVTEASEGVNPHTRFFPLLQQVRAERFNVSTPDFELALEKLEQDKYIKSVKGFEIKGENPFAEPSEYPAYAINFNGQYFILTENGYLGRQQTLEAKILSDDEAKSQDRLNQKLLVIGAFAASAGAIGLVVWEMGVHFCWW